MRFWCSAAGPLGCILIFSRISDGLGGKGYVLFSGEVGDVEAAVDAAEQWSVAVGHLLEARLIPQLAAEMAFNLRSDLRFRHRIVLRPMERSR